MSLSVKHYLDIYRYRKSMQDHGITNPPGYIKDWVSETVRKLEALEATDKIELRRARSGKIEFVLVSTGDVIAQAPRNENI